MNLFIYPQFSNSGMSEISRGYAKLFGIPTNTDDFREYELTLFKMFVEEHYLPSIENILKSYLFSILGMFKAICLPIDMPLTMAMSATQTALKNLSPDEAAEEFWLRPIETANLTEFKKQYEAVVKFIK